MLPLESSDWESLRHAYGQAADIPGLLHRASNDFRPGHVGGSTWFTLWSSLCHQNACYTASYAALPHLLAIAEARKGTDALFDPLHLAACIELARLEGTGPVLPSDLAPSYFEALKDGAAQARDAMTLHWPRDYREALRASLAAFEGLAAEARAIFDSEPDDDVIEEDGRLL